MSSASASYRISAGSCCDSSARVAAICVVAGCRTAGLDAGPFEAVVASDVPPGGGLSSSGEIEVAVATLIEAMTGKRLDPLQKALLCQKAEHKFAGVPCGIMDQCSSVMGREGALLLLDCRSPRRPTHAAGRPRSRRADRQQQRPPRADRRRLRGPPPPCKDAAHALGVAALRDVSREQLEAARGRLDDVHYRRARHVVGEIGRTVAAAEAIRRGDWAAVGGLMHASHVSLRDDYQVSCEELDLLVELAAEAGVIGSRMTGGGFGGCTISLVRRETLDAVVRHVRKGYLRKTGREATAFMTRPVDGARVYRRPDHPAQSEPRP